MVGIFTICSCNWCSLTCASPPLTKIFVRRKTLNDFVSFQPVLPLKTASSHYLDLQKENGLLSTQWAFRPRKVDPVTADPERPCCKPSWGESLKMMSGGGFLNNLLTFAKVTRLTFRQYITLLPE